MHRYIVLLLITGIVWAQTDFDKLVLKDGTTYLGEYSKIEEEIVYFKPLDAFAFQPISIKQIEKLELKDGKILYDVSNVKYSLALEDYQTLSTKEKGIYDAKYNKSMRHEKLNLNHKEKEIYEKAYLNTVNIRRAKYILGFTIVTGAVAFLMLMDATPSGLSSNKFTGFGPT